MPQHAAHVADTARGRDGSLATPAPFNRKVEGAFDPHSFLASLDSDEEPDNSDEEAALLAIYDGFDLSEDEVMRASKM